MKKTVTLILLLAVCFCAFIHPTAARTIKRLDGILNPNEWATTAYMKKTRSHSDPAVLFIESLSSSSSQVYANMFNTASEKCVNDQSFSDRERRECNWKSGHGEPGYRYFAGVICSEMRSITSSFSPDTY